MRERGEFETLMQPSWSGSYLRREADEVRTPAYAERLARIAQELPEGVRP